MTFRHSRDRPIAALAFALLLLASSIAPRGNSAAQVRAFIDQQVGGIETLLVPANDADLPQPRLSNGSPDPRFRITEAKRYLGKQLFTTRFEPPEF